MFYLICAVLYTILIHLTTTKAIEYINVPKLLQYQNQETIAYDRQTPTHYVMISENEIEADGVEKKIYTCRIGGLDFQGIIDCFPFPSLGAIPKHRDVYLAEYMCQNLAEMYVAYWMGENMVWCNKASAQAIPNGAVKVIQVPKPLDYEFGKTVIYDYRSIASHQIEPFITKSSISGRKTEKTYYICRTGEFNFTKGFVEKLMTHCPYPSKRSAPRGEAESLQIMLCRDYALKFVVYWLDGRIVFCTEEKNHTESNLIMHHRGNNILNLNFVFWYTYGDKIYYDKITDGAIVDRIEEVYQAAKDKMIYKCIFGGLDYENEFSVCFPQRSEQKIRSSSYDEAKNECEKLAKIYQLYWENNRLVWCEIKKQDKRSGRKLTIESSRNSESSSKIPNHSKRPKIM